jgi:hypothetical protein
VRLSIHAALAGATVDFVNIAIETAVLEDVPTVDSIGGEVRHSSIAGDNGRGISTRLPAM